MTPAHTASTTALTVPVIKVASSLRPPGRDRVGNHHAHQRDHEENPTMIAGTCPLPPPVDARELTNGSRDVP